MLNIVVLLVCSTDDSILTTLKIPCLCCTREPGDGRKIEIGLYSLLLINLFQSYESQRNP